MARSCLSPCPLNLLDKALVGIGVLALVDRQSQVSYEGVDEGLVIVAAMCLYR